MAFYHTQTEVKLAIARFLEVAYNTDEELTASLLKTSGSLRVSVDSTGEAVMSGNSGSVMFRATRALKELGMQLRMAEITLHVNSDGMLEYNATFRFLRAASATTRGYIDVDKLITSCSGLLCRAARALEGARLARDTQLKEAIQ